MADRYDDVRGARGPGFGSQWLRDRTKERERFEIDSDEFDARLLARLDVAVEEVAVSDDEQDPSCDAPVVVLRLAEDVPVDHGLLDRDRQSLVSAEANSVFELLYVVDAADVEDPNADAVVGDAEPYALAGQLVSLEEAL